MNNVDVAISKLRELQQMFYSPDASPNSLFKKSQEVVTAMDKASIEIRTNYAEISKKLTDQLNTGRVQE
jgi:hypothetical protein